MNQRMVLLYSSRPGEYFRTRDDEEYVAAQNGSLHLLGKKEAKALARDRKRQRSLDARARRRDRRRG